MEEILVPVISGVVIVAFVVLVLVGVSAAKKKRSTCKKCKSKINYDNDVEWEVTSTRTDSNLRTVAKVGFECRCPKCGYVWKFTRDYTVSQRDKNGGYQEKNIENLIRNDFI